MAQDTLPTVPVGTIVAFAGDLDTGWLKKQGWLYCDGSSVAQSDYPELFSSIGKNYGGDRTHFNLPDTRGRFLRGVDLKSGHDPGASKRAASAAGGLAGDNPGSTQGYMTALPAKSLTAASAGAHKHDVPHAPTGKNAYKLAGKTYAKWRGGSSDTEEGGAHSHTIVGGGDAETRPINKYLFFIVKYTAMTTPTTPGARKRRGARR